MPQAFWKDFPTAASPLEWVKILAASCHVDPMWMRVVSPWRWRQTLVSACSSRTVRKIGGRTLKQFLRCLGKFCFWLLFGVLRAPCSCRHDFSYSSKSWVTNQLLGFTRRARTLLSIRRRDFGLHDARNSAQGIPSSGHASWEFAEAFMHFWGPSAPCQHCSQTTHSGEADQRDCHQRWVCV